MDLTKSEIKLLDSLERRFKINIRKATPEQITKIFTDDSFQVDFSNEDDTASNEFTEVLNLLGKVIEEKTTRDVVNSSAIMFKLVQSRNKLVNIYDSYQNSVYTREEFVNLIRSEIESKDSLVAINALLINYENLLGIELSEEKVLENLYKLKDFSEDIETTKITYLGKTELVNLVCYFLDTYFKLVGTKICEKHPDIWEWVKEEISKLQKVEDEDFKRPSEFDLPEDEQIPEELGLIDITKFKDN